MRAAAKVANLNKKLTVEDESIGEVVLCYQQDFMFGPDVLSKSSKLFPTRR